MSKSKKTPAPKLTVKANVKAGVAVMYSSAFTPRRVAKKQKARG